MTIDVSFCDRHTAADLAPGWADGRLASVKWAIADDLARIGDRGLAGGRLHRVSVQIMSEGKRSHIAIAYAQ